MGLLGYFATRRALKREIVKMSTPLIDRIKDTLFLWAVAIILVLILAMIVRGHVNGKW